MNPKKALAKIDEFFEQAEKLRHENIGYITIDDLKKNVKGLFFKMDGAYDWLCGIVDEARNENRELKHTSQKMADVLEKLSDAWRHGDPKFKREIDDALNTYKRRKAT